MSKQVIQVASQQIELPEGITVAEWALEKVRWQNPRIRAILGCIRLLDTVLESNYAILHCSPERLLDIWHKVRQVSSLMRTKVAPLLRAPSQIPRLRRACRKAEIAFDMLAGTVLSELDRFPDEIPSQHVLEVRKLLCTSIGQMHTYLQDTLGSILANDPRSLHDADYFLSRRFPQDIEEAEWLRATVERLRDYLSSIEPGRARHLSRLASSLRQEKRIADGPSWEGASTFFGELLHHLTPKLKEVLALRGIRFYEMEILDRYAVELPVKCTLLQDLHTTACESLDALGALDDGSLDGALLQSIFSRRIAGVLSEVDEFLRDLTAFIPLWLTSIERRRALMLAKSPDGAEAAND